MHSVATFRELQRDPKVQPEWHEVGSLRIALSERRAEEFRQLKSVADQSGLETELIDNAAAKRLWPAMQFGGAKAVLWCASDGYMKPCLCRGQFLRLSIAQTGRSLRRKYFSRGLDPGKQSSGWRENQPRLGKMPGCD